MASKQDTNDVFADESPTFGAREVVGCFTESQVQRALGQTSTDTLRNQQQIVEDSSKWELSASSGDHFLADCICSPLHAHCSEFPGPEEPARTSIVVTLEQLRQVSEAGCSLCSTIYGAFISAPAWDPNRKEAVPKLLTFMLNSGLAEGQYFGVNLFERRDPALMFYTNGKLSSLEIKIKDVC
jgi:hypothetical protein